MNSPMAVWVDRVSRVREAFGESFDVPRGYLDTAAIGVPFARAADALVDTVRTWRAGSMRVWDFDDDIGVAREAWAQLVGVYPSHVATGSSVSQLVRLVASSVSDNTKVLTVHNEFTSVTFPFVAQQHRGVTVTESTYSELIPQVCEHDLVAISAVQSADGTVMNLGELQAAVGETGALVLLDVSQAAGWLPLQLDWAHFVVGAGYKWLLTPRGAAWMAVRPDVLRDVVPQVANWSGAHDMWSSLYGLPLRLSDQARRLDSSPVWFAQRGAAVALPWVAGLDLTEVRKHCVALADATLAGLGEQPRGSAIVSLDLPPDAAVRLVHAGATVSTRAGRTRLSFHLYNTMDDVDLVLKALT
jgi:selenocysteine lyase/cysteine desulfurase